VGTVHAVFRLTKAALFKKSANGDGVTEWQKTVRNAQFGVWNWRRLPGCR